MEISLRPFRAPRILFRASFPLSLHSHLHAPRTPSAFAPGFSGPLWFPPRSLRFPLHSHRIPRTLSASHPSSIPPGLLSLAPSGPWPAGGCSGAGTLDAVNRDLLGQSETPWCWLLGHACQVRPRVSSRAPSPGLTGFYFGLPGLGLGAPDVARCTQTGAAGREGRHRRAVGAARPWLPDDSEYIILEPPGTASFSSGCTCCWRPMICWGLVLLGAPPVTA